MLSKQKFLALSNFEILEWLVAQEWQFYEKIWEISNQETLQGVVGYLKENYDTVKSIYRQKEK